MAFTNGAMGEGRSTPQPQSVGPSPLAYSTMEAITPRDSSDVHSWESILEIPTKARKSLQAALRFAPPELVRDSPLVEELRSIPQLQMSLRLRFESDTLREIVQRSRVSTGGLVMMARPVSPGAGAVVSAFMEERSIIGVCVVKDYIRVHMVYAGTVAASLISQQLGHEAPPDGDYVLCMVSFKRGGIKSPSPRRLQMSTAGDSQNSPAAGSAVDEDCGGDVTAAMNVLFNKINRILRSSNMNSLFKQINKKGRKAAGAKSGEEVAIDFDEFRHGMKTVVYSKASDKMLQRIYTYMDVGDDHLGGSKRDAMLTYKEFRRKLQEHQQPWNYAQGGILEPGRVPVIPSWVDNVDYDVIDHLSDRDKVGDAFADQGTGEEDYEGDVLQVGLLSR